jgi:hypothetical protein
LTYYQGKIQNFWQEVYAVIWRLLLRVHFVDEGDDELFVGIERLRARAGR